MENLIDVPQVANALPLMSNVDIVRAWKDAGYRRSLSAEQLQQLPGNPAGPSQLSDDELLVAGGIKQDLMPLTTAITCTEFTHRTFCCP